MEIPNGGMPGVIFESWVRAGSTTQVITFVSDHIEQMLGYRKEELLHWPNFWLSIVHAGDRERARHEAAAILANGKRGSYQFRCVARNGHIVWAETHLTVVLDETRRPAGVHGLTLDITQRKQTEEALHKAQAELAHISRVTLMGELAASIAHEINQPLTAILTNADLCLDWVQSANPDWNQIREILQDIVRDAHRVGDVSGGIRSLLRKGVPEKAPLSINAAIWEVCALVRSEVASKQADLQAELAADLPTVMGDRVRLQQVLLNLLKNGIDAIAEVQGPRELLIRSARHGSDEVLVTVRDSGVGLAPRELERIFEPFFTTKKQGLGMGLSISRTIIHDHQGRMWATSNPGGGLTFHFTLPAYREEAL